MEDLPVSIASETRLRITPVAFCICAPWMTMGTATVAIVVQCASLQADGAQAHARERLSACIGRYV